PQALKRMYKACLKYPSWKEQHEPGFKPWLYPEQSRLPPPPLSELSLQHAESLENIDESGVSEGRDERGDGSDEDN
ncbi:PCTP-like, partial [Calypte anna]